MKYRYIGKTGYYGVFHFTKDKIYDKQGTCKPETNLPMHYLLCDVGNKFYTYMRQDIFNEVTEQE